MLSRTDEAARREIRVASIESEVDKLTRLVDMLVLLSALDSGAPLNLVPTDLNDLTRRIVEAANWHHKTFRIEWDFDPAIGLYPVDPQYFAEALRQIVDNALRNTADGGVIQIRSRVEDNRVCIRIRDSGCGIGAEILPHIFERFFRADTAHSTPGIGLGLPIAQRILEMHGGSVEVKSQPAQGSEFALILPPESAEPQMSLADSSAPPIGSYR